MEITLFQFVATPAPRADVILKTGERLFRNRNVAQNAIHDSVRALGQKQMLAASKQNIVDNMSRNPPPVSKHRNIPLNLSFSSTSRLLKNS